jgi:hypothetical protein
MCAESELEAILCKSRNPIEHILEHLLDAESRVDTGRYRPDNPSEVSSDTYAADAIDCEGAFVFACVVARATRVYG